MNKSSKILNVEKFLHLCSVDGGVWLARLEIDGGDQSHAPQSSASRERSLQGGLNGSAAECESKLDAGITIRSETFKGCWLGWQWNR